MPGPSAGTDAHILDQELAYLVPPAAGTVWQRLAPVQSKLRGPHEHADGTDMADATAAAPDAATALDAASDSVSFFANILTPGSSFHPTFLLIADAAFLGLFFVLLALLFVTKSLHFAVLILVEAGLWLSVKWFVNELRKTEMEARASAEKKDT
ncbi:uncharacterized protein SCHCODRAFT_02700610 [Schizophyllum commune H4-8]|nr:uncharacterized protein SCHCODRAFT_02700610 [Schizophyllum commune H4-8]KAI5894054.1 hypothetical protein SCHCODRAFT_02700610 [Schizophyllum commune H4-8]